MDLLFRKCSHGKYLKLFPISLQHYIDPLFSYKSVVKIRFTFFTCFCYTQYMVDYQIVGG